LVNIATLQEIINKLWVWTFFKKVLTMFYLWCSFTLRVSWLCAVIITSYSTKNFYSYRCRMYIISLLNIFKRQCQHLNYYLLCTARHIECKRIYSCGLYSNYLILAFLNIIFTSYLCRCIEFAYNNESIVILFIK